MDDLSLQSQLSEAYSHIQDILISIASLTGYIQALPVTIPCSSLLSHLPSLTSSLSSLSSSISQSALSVHSSSLASLWGESVGSDCSAFSQEIAHLKLTLTLQKMLRVKGETEKGALVAKGIAEMVEVAFAYPRHADASHAPPVRSDWWENPWGSLTTFEIEDSHLKELGRTVTPTKASEPQASRKAVRDVGVQRKGRCCKAMERIGEKRSKIIENC